MAAAPRHPAGRPDGEPAWVADVIGFWLEETPPAARFSRSDAFDEAIRQRFGALYEQVRASPPGPAVLTPRLALAAVIALDQFPRNMFRGLARAFEADAAARELARAAVGQGHDQAVDPAARLFFYLPFEHSEDMADQLLSMQLIASLGDPELDRYAVAHGDIIRRFGRFPHRNVALGRASTAEEAAFLQGPGSSF